MDQNNQTQCVNCQTVTTSDGKTVWVCENCGEVNQPADIAPSENQIPESAAAPTVPTETVPAADVSAAQQELDQAASQLGTPAAAPADTQVMEKTSGSSL